MHWKKNTGLCVREAQCEEPLPFAIWVSFSNSFSLSEPDSLPWEKAVVIRWCEGCWYEERAGLWHVALSAPPFCLHLSGIISLSKHEGCKSFYYKTKTFKCLFKYFASREAVGNQAHLFLLVMYLPHFCMKINALIRGRKKHQLQSGVCSVMTHGPWEETLLLRGHPDGMTAQPVRSQRCSLTGGNYRAFPGLECWLSETEAVTGGRDTDYGWVTPL